MQLGNVYYYVREIKNTDVVERYARDIKDGWWDTHVFNHGLLGLGIGTALLCVVLGPVIGVWWALLAAGIHAVMYVFVLSSSINGLCHHVGYKNFDNTATNIRFARAADRRRRAAQQPSRLSAQPEVQLPRERDRSGVAGDQAADRAASSRSRTRRSKKSRR